MKDVTWLIGYWKSCFIFKNISFCPDTKNKFCQYKKNQQTMTSQVLSKINCFGRCSMFLQWVHIPTIADAVGALLRSPPLGWCTHPLASASAIYWRLSAAPSSKKVGQLHGTIHSLELPVYEAEATLLKAYLCLTFSPAPACSPSLLQVTPSSSSSVYLLHKNPHLRLYFQGTHPIHPPTHFCVAQGQWAILA